MEYNRCGAKMIHKSTDSFHVQYFVNNGKREGICHFFDRRYNIFNELNYIDGVLNGRHLTYHSNGNIESETYYINGIRSIPCIYYDTYGNIKGV